MARRCAYKECRKKTENSEGLNFFPFPTNDFRKCVDWVKNANKTSFVEMSSEQLRKEVVCQLHFENNCFTDESKKELVKGAVPTLDSFPSTVVGIQTGNSVLPANKNNIQPILNCTTACFSNAKKIKIDNLTSTYDKNFAKVGTTNGSISESKTENNLFPRASTSTGNVSTSTKPLNPPTTDLTKMARTVARHSLEIARLHDTLRGHIVLNNCDGRAENKHILLQLERLIPPSLYTIVSLHLATSNVPISDETKRFFTTLHRDFPSTYNYLVENCDWKLPSIERLNI